MSPKYPRTLHLPWSPGVSKDDRIATDVSTLLNVPIIISEKCDGSNTSLESGGCFARTHSGPPSHSSFDGLKALHANIKHKIPKGIQLFGEWVFAKHSIFYDQLPGYFLLFNVRELNEKGYIWYSWDDVEMWAEEIEVPTVPPLFKGQTSTEEELMKITESLMNQPSVYGDTREGVVVRIANNFDDITYSKYIMKSVRKNHVNTNTHWLHQEIFKNKLK